jgi:hypothetical protein
VLTRNITAAEAEGFNKEHVFDCGDASSFFNDANGELFVIVENEKGKYVPFFVGTLWIEGRKPTYPLTPAPKGTSFTITQE